MIYIALPDDEAGRSMAQALELGFNATVAESDSSQQLASVDQRMKQVLEMLQREGTLVHKYDHVWIMRYINEEHIKKMGLFFCSIKSFRDYLTQYMDCQQPASQSTLSYYYSCGEGRFPEWTFSDTKDATERLRRVNVARRFAAAFIKGC